MKLNKWLYGAAALAMLAACSDKDVAPGGDNPNNSSGTSGLVNGFIAVDINLPEETGTRTEENDQFDDGLPSEWKVNDAMLVLFVGKDEKSAKFAKAIDLKKPFFENKPSDNNITSSYVAAVPVEKIDGGDNYYGLVILNRDASTSIPSSDRDGTYTGVIICGLPLTKGTTTFQNILDKTVDNINFTANGFFMTNSPLAKGPGSASSSAADITYLTNLGNETWPSAAEAKDHLAGCIFVERAVAKVTCDLGTNPYKFTIVDTDDEGNIIEVTDITENYDITPTIKYALTNTNNGSYIVRNVESDKLGDHFSWNVVNKNKYRMIGQKVFEGLFSPYHKDPVNLYRTYWCHDPNYDDKMTDSQKHVFDPVKNATDTYKSITEPLYCNENTFTVRYQNYGNTTLAIFKVDLKITPKGGSQASNLYIKDGDQSKIYLSAKTAASDEIFRIGNNTDIQNALLAALKASGKTTGTFNNLEKYLDITFGTDVTDPTLLAITNVSISTTIEGSPFNEEGAKAFRDLIGYADGTTKVKERDKETGAIINRDAEGNIVETGGTPKEIDNTILYDLLDGINKWCDITRYEGGTSYYVKPIKHFGDHYCPWDEVVGETTEEVYNENSATWEADSHAAKYLGRYGMVRNNWYDLSISQISGLGDAALPNIDAELSDDNKVENKFIAIEIHTLAWAKRTQNIIF